MDSYHFIGIGGIGMSALAHILKDKGYRVSGSDAKDSVITQTLVNKGIKFFLGHDPENIPKGSIIVYSSGITKENPELRTGYFKKHHLQHRSELLSRLLKGYRSLLISGSHGKTTSSALLISVLKTLGAPFNFAIGGFSEGMNGCYHSESHFFIAEADESDGSLKNYFPDGSIITNIDNEHLDYYGSIEHLYRLFETYVNQVRESRLLFYNGDQKLEEKIPSLKKGFSFGFSESCALRVVSYRQDKWKSYFTVTFQERSFSDIEVALPGNHNILNAAAVFGLCINLGIKEENIRLGLKEFSGVERRLEIKRDDDYLLTIDDYAHHPEEIASTLYGLRKAVGYRRIVAVCQPHRYARVKLYCKEYREAFVNADVVVITDIYSPSGEQDIWKKDVSSRELAESIQQANKQSVFYIPKENVEEFLKIHLQVHDVVIYLGAGDINGIHKTLVNFIPNKLNVALVFGGTSCEHTISLLSSRWLDRQLNKLIYDVSYFGINKEGKWITGTEAQRFLQETDFEEIPKDAGHRVTEKLVMDALQKVSVFCPILHGPLGEDGIIQGFFEILNKPYTGPNVCFAAISMDKVISKRLAASVGVPVVPWLDFIKEEWLYNSEKLVTNILNTFSFPVFVKASHLGSSLGVFLVNEEKELREALREAFNYDDHIIVEESKLGSREIEFSVLGNSRSSFLIKSDPSERLGKGFFIDYRSKYGLEGHDNVTSAFALNLDESLLRKGMKLSEKVYNVLGGKGCARIDFFLDKEKRFWFSEINSIPGMTESSPFPIALANKGVSFEKTCCELIINALYNHREKRK